MSGVEMEPVTYPTLDGNRRTRKFTRVADRAFSEVKVTSRQPGDFWSFVGSHFIKDHFPLPDPKTLAIGDRIRILRVPDCDLRQREVEKSRGAELPGWTADSIERIIAQTPVVPISRIDGDGCVWYETSIIGPDGTEEYHSLIVYNDDTWKKVDDELD